MARLKAAMVPGVRGRELLACARKEEECEGRSAVVLCADLDLLLLPSSLSHAPQAPYVPSSPHHPPVLSTRYHDDDKKVVLHLPKMKKGINAQMNTRTSLAHTANHKPKVGAAEMHTLYIKNTPKKRASLPRAPRGGGGGGVEEHSGRTEKKKVK